MPMPRSRLLARLFASEPRLIRLCAPPGHGKSSLARLYARRFDRHAVCDCSGIADARDFAERVLAALSGEVQGGSDSMAAARLRLHATEADAATWSRAMLDAWKSRHEHGLFVLEHAEAIADNSGVLALLADMFAARPPERVVLVTSRVPLPLRFAQYLAPHQMLTLSRSELRYDDTEAAGIFEGSELSAEVVNRIVRLADGWPIVLLLLALFAQYDSNIERMIERLAGVAGDDLYESLANEVLSAFTPELMSAMMATASIPNACLEDISAATGLRHATPIVDRLLSLPGFVSSETGSYQMHPLLRGTLRARHGVDHTNYLLRAANHYERSGDDLRAAELYAVSGDEEAAATALDRLAPATLQQPSHKLIDVLLRIKTSTLCAHPNLWIAMLPFRRPRFEPAQLYDEALRLLQSAAPEKDLALHRSLRLRLATLALQLDKLAEARALLEDRAGAANEAPEERRIALMTQALIASKQGRFAESDGFVDQCDAVPGARHVRFEAERAQIAVEKARLLGDWFGGLKTSEEALYAAQRSGDTSRIIEAAKAVANAAWYCNDDAREIAANEMLEDCGDPEAKAFGRYVEAARSTDDIDAPARALHVARLHAALAAPNASRAGELVDRAIDGIDEIENPFLRITIRVYAALLLPTQRRRLLEARTIAQKIESPPLQASLELLIDSPEPSDFGIFKLMAARVARSPLKQRQDVLRVDVVRGEVRRGSQPLHVSDRGFELIVALALSPPGTSKEELAATIWPGLDGDAALNALKMCVSRTRAQIGEKEAILSTKRGYALNDTVPVDVREFERTLRDLRGSEALGDPMRRHVERAIAALQARERAYTAGWVWFAPHIAHLDALQRDLAMALAKDSFRRDDAAVRPYAGVSTSKSS
jgi:DNA-binding winged helix-turn-helix (wHTH) protein